jgi:hypothetical protein
MAEETTAPWKREGQVFDEAAADRYFQGLLDDKHRAQARASDFEAKLISAEGEVDGLKRGLTKSQREVDVLKSQTDPNPDLQKANDRLKVALELGLTEKQANRLVGEKYEDLLEDGKDFANDLGIQVNGGEDEGTDGADVEGEQDGAEGGNGELPNFRAQSNLSNGFQTGVENKATNYEELASSIKIQ